MTSSRLLIAEVGIPRHEAVRLLAAATSTARSDVIAGFEVDPEPTRRFLEMLESRASGTPLQYLEGSVTFGPLELTVDARALVPRPETEYLWSLLSSRLADPGRIVDVGTGSGALALALKKSFPLATVMATDLSAEAVTLARHNAEQAGLELDVRHGDLFAPLPAGLAGCFDLVVSNPPYVAESDWATLPMDIRDHEPRLALVGGESGLEVVARLVSDALGWLRPGGLLAIEIADSQGGQVMAMAGQYQRPTIEQDLAGRDRYLFASRPGGWES